MVKLNLKKLAVDLSPVVKDWDGRPRINEEYDWEPIPGEYRLDLVDGSSRIPSVVSKSSKTPFKMVAVDTWDQCVVEVVIEPNLSDYSEEEWLEKFGNEYALEGREIYCDIRVPFTHPDLGFTQIRFEMEDLDGLTVEAVICVKEKILVAQLPLEALDIDSHLTSVAITGLSRNGWEPNPHEINRIMAECSRWNSTQWVPLTGTYVQQDFEYGDDDRRITAHESHCHTWWQDPTGYFQGPCKHRKSQWGVYADRPQLRNPEREIQEIFLVKHWLDKWLPSLMHQWGKSLDQDA